MSLAVRKSVLVTREVEDPVIKVSLSFSFKHSYLEVSDAPEYQLPLLKFELKLIPFFFFLYLGSSLLFSFFFSSFPI